MNCEHMRDILIDLVYEELDDAQRQAAMAHVSSCPACRAELGKLQVARAALAVHRAGEETVERGAWSVERKDLPHAPRATRHAPRLTLYALRAATALAALLVLGVLLWLWQSTLSPAQAAGVEIKRVGVSLTILSAPENWPIKWPGTALVRDERIVRNLPPGVSKVSFTDVPSAIWPDSVRLRGVDAPDDLKILEQNYQYDLASADAVLKRYVDRPVMVTLKDGGSESGSLLSFDRASLVLQNPGRGPRTIAREAVRAIALEKLPEGLLTRPTLVWDVENRQPRREQRFEVAYLTNGLTWRADYVLKLRPLSPRERVAASSGGSQPGEGTSGQSTRPVAQVPSPVSLAGASDPPSPGRSEDAAGRGGEDTADLVGYATVTNLSGTTYEDAQLKLMAGDVNLIRPPILWMFDGEMGGNGLIMNAGDLLFSRGAPVFHEKSFFEYHLYTLSLPTTLRDKETKQIELVSGSGIKLTRGYVYDPAQDHKTAVRVVSELKNSKENGLGKPLPKGTMRLYVPDPEGAETYVSQTTIDHTPVDEKLRFQWGHAFDIACSWRTEGYFSVDVHDPANHHEIHDLANYYEIRNHKPYDVTVTVLVRVRPSTYKAECNYPWHVREVGLVEVQVPVKAGQAASVTFKSTWNDEKGGGLPARGGG